MVVERAASQQYAFRVLLVLVAGLVTALASSLLGLEAQQVLALTAFLMTIYATLLLWTYRLPFAFLGVSALFLLGVLDVEYFVEHSHLDVIAFLIAMMTIVGYLEEDRFFEFLAQEIVRRVGVNFRATFLVVVFLSGFLAPLVDEVTSILVMLSVVLPLSGKIGVDPLPLVIASIFATNIGSAMTPLGNPVGVLVAFESGLTFSDFLARAAPVSALSLVVAAAILMHLFRGYIEEGNALASQRFTDEWSVASLERRTLYRDASVFSATILFIAAHHVLEEALGLPKNSLLLAAPLMVAGLIMLLDPSRGFHALETKVEWPTLVFFLLLFASVGALEKTGVVEALSKSLGSLSASGVGAFMGAFTLSSSLMSAFMDNVIAVAILSRVVHELGAQGFHTEPFWWLTLFSAVYAGNLSPIGSTANIVALSVLEKRLGRSAGFKEWLRVGLPVTAATLALGFAAVYLQIP